MEGQWRSLPGGSDLQKLESGDSGVRIPVRLSSCAIPLRQGFGGQEGYGGQEIPPLNNIGG